MNSELKPIREGLFDAGPPARLRGGYCPQCRRKFFPEPMVCPHCLGPVETTDLSQEGRIYTFSVIRIRPPFGLPQPYPVGYVDLEADGLRVFSLLDPESVDDLSIGQPVSLRVGPIGVDSAGQPCLRYYFSPRRGGE